MAETASSCGTRGRNSQRRRARRDSRARTADTTSVSTSVRHGPTNSGSAEWNTRQESNLRALGSKPNGDAGNPRLVYWIRRQESDLRGLRSERSWDASNPHLNSLAGRQGIEPCLPVLETSLLPEDNPNWRRAVSASHMPRAARSAFQTAPGPRRTHSPNWRKAVGLDPHIREDATRFRGEGAPRALHLPMLAEAERVERSRPLRIIVGFKPT